MREGRICVGAHDLENFRGLRLYKHDGTYLHEDDNIRVGQIWELWYDPKPNLEPPHLEDVLVAREGRGSSEPRQTLPGWFSSATRCGPPPKICSKDGCALRMLGQPMCLATELFRHEALDTGC